MGRIPDWTPQAYDPQDVVVGQPPAVSPRRSLTLLPPRKSRRGGLAAWAPGRVTLARLTGDPLDPVPVRAAGKQVLTCLEAGTFWAPPFTVEQDFGPWEGGWPSSTAVQALATPSPGLRAPTLALPSPAPPGALLRPRHSRSPS